MVVSDDRQRRPRTPKGYKVAGKNTFQLREIAEQLIPLLQQQGCYNTSKGPDFLDAEFLLENLLFRAKFQLHVVEKEKFPETCAFCIPEEKLIVLRKDIYDSLEYDDPFARYTVVHEFAHIYLNHSITLHRNAVLGQHQWYEDSEWQANNLAAELLMPVAVIKKLGGKPLLIQDACGVSSAATNYRINNLQRTNVI